jgi:hypothetical protein
MTAFSHRAETTSAWERGIFRRKYLHVFGPEGLNKIAHHENSWKSAGLEMEWKMLRGGDRLTIMNNKMSFISRAASLGKYKALVAVATMAPAAMAGLVNGGFESPPVSPNSVNFPVTIPGWRTTDSAFEIWGTGYGAVPSYEGNQFAELNAYLAGTLSQDVSGISAGSRVGFEFAHRGRAGVDTMRFTLRDLGLDGQLGGGDDTVLFTKDYSDGTSAWGFYDASAEAPILALGNKVEFSYQALSAVGGASIGNFLDAADFGVGVGGVPSTAPEAGSTLAFLGLGSLVLAGLARRRPVAVK